MSDNLIFVSDAVSGLFEFTWDEVLADDFLERVYEQGGYGKITYFDGPQEYEMFECQDAKDVHEAAREMDWDAVWGNDWHILFSILIDEYHVGSLEDLVELSHGRSDMIIEEWDSAEDMARGMVRDGLFEVSDSIYPYIDWESLARDLLVDYSEISGPRVGYRNFYIR